MGGISSLFDHAVEGIQPHPRDQFLPFFDEHREYLDSIMCDWLTIHTCSTNLPESVIRKLQASSSRICKISPEGVIDSEWYSWDSVRSDTHQVCFRVGSDFWIQGSPARLGLPNNAFGSSDLRYCATKMIDFVRDQLQLDFLPSLERWKCTRVDITRNYLMQSEAEARQALEYLKQSPPRRQKHSFETNGFYIGKGSALHKGKIYLKGEDAHRNMRLGRAWYTPEQLLKSEKLLRAEYTLARLGIRRLFESESKQWFDLTSDDLKRMHTEFFHEYFSNVEVTDMNNLLERLEAVALTERRARSAYDCYSRIRMYGYNQAKVTYPYSTFQRHIGFLKQAGLTQADLQPINVIPLRKRAILLSDPVRHWDDIPLIALAR